MSALKELASRLKDVGATISGDTLQLEATAQRGALQLRVIEGRVFGREQTDGRWSEADWRELPVERLMEFFMDDSPVATWLRESGADVIQAALLSLVWPR